MMGEMRKEQGNRIAGLLYLLGVELRSSPQSWRSMGQGVSLANGLSKARAKLKLVRVGCDEPKYLLI